MRGMFALVAVVLCLPCHRDVVESYAKTGMGRSFFRLTESVRVEDFRRGNRVEHAASKTVFTMTERGGRYYMRANEAEKEIHYVLGSGNHARSYVHVTPQGRLLALPVSWYTREDGLGYWQMAPGFDRPDHPRFRRRVGYDCFFCHNSYPTLPAGADVADPLYASPLPEGIDCSRCHGPAEEHVRAPGRGNILNPRKLGAERQMEVCLQCHLESTSQPLPFALRTFGRPFFSYDPREPLRDYMIHFDHEDNAPWNRKFEVVGAPYRMMQSACYQKSAGRMTCLTCHNPHERPASVDSTCRTCHEKTHAGVAARRRDCAGCHMAKRAPEDAPLTRFTDHKISRVPERGRGPDLPEYSGRVRVYWPPGGDGGIYEKLVNPSERGALARRPPAEPEALVALAERTGDAALLERALEKAPTLLGAWRRLALLRFPDLTLIERGLAARPGDPFLLTLEGEALRREGKFAEGERALRAAINADPDQPEPYVNLGVLLAQLGRRAEAARMFGEALAVDPGNRAAAGNLRLLEER